MAGSIKSYSSYALIIVKKNFQKSIDFMKMSIDFLYLKYHGVDTKFGYVKLLGFPLIRKERGSSIVIEKGVTLVSKMRDNIAGINHPVILATLSSNASIIIGEGSGASGSVICSASSIIIGKNVALGANCKLYDTDFHPVNPIKRLHQRSINDSKSLPIIIRDSVWVCEGALVLKGVTLEYGSVVGARSVVYESVDSLQIVTGNPAVFVRNIVL